MRLSTSDTSILYFVIQNAKITKKNYDSAIRSKVNIKDQNRSIKSNTNYEAFFAPYKNELLSKPQFNSVDVRKQFISVVPQ